MVSCIGSLAFACTQLDPGNTCAICCRGGKRSLSLPQKRRRAFSSLNKTSASLASQAGKATVAASVAQVQTKHQNPVCSPLLCVEDRLRQLEASYQAQPAAELQTSNEQQPASTSDSASSIQGDFVQLERIWRAQAKPSSSGRSSDLNSAVTFASRAYQRRPNTRSKRRSSRLYAASTRRHQAQGQGVEAKSQPSGCPDSQYLAVIRERLQLERQKSRVSRSEWTWFCTSSCLSSCIWLTATIAVTVLPTLAKPYAHVALACRSRTY